jgi:hypothetical protein
MSIGMGKATVDIKNEQLWIGKNYVDVKIEFFYNKINNIKIKWNC